MTRNRLVLYTFKRKGMPTRRTRTDLRGGQVENSLSSTRPSESNHKYVYRLIQAWWRKRTWGYWWMKNHVLVILLPLFALTTCSGSGWVILTIQVEIAIPAGSLVPFLCFQTVSLELLWTFSARHFGLMSLNASTRKIKWGCSLYFFF